MRRIQLRLWHLMLTIAVVALIAAGLIWLFAPEQPSVSPLTLVFDHHIHDVYLNIAGKEIRQNSPIFWVIAGALLTTVVGILAGVIAACIWAARKLAKTQARNA